MRYLKVLCVMQRRLSGYFSSAKTFLYVYLQSKVEICHVHIHTRIWKSSLEPPETKARKVHVDSIDITGNRP